jgi:hypothetical protein
MSYNIESLVIEQPQENSVTPPNKILQIAFVASESLHLLLLFYGLDQYGQEIYLKIPKRIVKERLRICSVEKKNAYLSADFVLSELSMLIQSRFFDSNCLQ